MVIEMPGELEGSVDVVALQENLKVTEEKLKEKDEQLQSILQTTVPAPKYKELASNFEETSQEVFSLKAFVADLQKLVCCWFTLTDLNRRLNLNTKHDFMNSLFVDVVS